MIFSYFKPIKYGGKLTTNIFKDYQNYLRKIQGNFKFRTYNIIGSPRPEQLAHQIYGNENYYWVLLLINNVVDPFHGWIKSQEECYQSAIQKYKDMKSTVDPSVDYDGVNNRVLYHVDNDGTKFYNLVEDEENPRNWFDKGDRRKLHVQYVGLLRPVDIFEDAINENEIYREIKIVDPRDLNNFVAAFVREMEKVKDD